MSEYWVSHKKYLCKYCDIFIADDAPSRQQHENGLRHKGNVERFVRGLYKAGEKKVKDLEEEKREMARVERAAQAAYASDVGAGRARDSAVSSPVASSSASRKPVPRPSDPYTNYSTAQSLGYTDPDAEFLKAEAERRRTQGVAGEWELVTAATAPRIMPNSEDAVGMKRMREVEDEDRSWKLRKKTLGVGLGDIYDPGIIATTPRATQEERVSMPDGISGVPDKLPETTDETSKKSKWKTLDDEDSSSPRTVPMPVAEEGTDSEKQDFPRAPRTSEPPSRDEEPRNVAAQSDSLLTNLPPASLFRKRKAASGGGSRGKRP